MPAKAGVDMAADGGIKLSQHRNILGLKDSGGNPAKIGEVVRQAKAGFQVLAGSAGFLYPALCTGAVGGVLALASIAPQQSCNILSFFKQSKHDEARELLPRGGETMIPIRVLLMILALVIALPTATWAQGGPPPVPSSAPPSKDRPMKRELPPEAKALLEKHQGEMRALREKCMEEMKALRQKHREERHSLMQKLRQERGLPRPAPEKKTP